MEFKCQKECNSLFKLKQLVVLLFIVFCFGCSPIPHYIKKGDTAFKQMDFDAAATYYYNILLIDSSNSIAKDALSKTANLVLANKFSRFGNLVAQNRTEEALQQYQFNQKYFEKVKAVQVNLYWPSMYDGLYEEVKFEFIKKKTDEISNSLSQNKYDQAEALIEQFASIEPVFRNATILRQELLLNAYLNYAKKLDQNKKSFKALELLKTVQSFLKSNQTTDQFLVELILKIRKKLVLFPIEEQVNSGNFAGIFELNFVQALNQIQPDLMQVIAGAQVKNYLPDSIKQTNELNTISKTLKLAGVHLYLQLAINEFKTSILNPKNADSIMGYEAFVQKLPAKDDGFPVSVYRFKPVKYGYVKKCNKIQSRITYRLVDCESQLTITENLIDLSVADSVESFFYSGDLKSLYKEKPVANQMPERNQAFYDQFNLVQTELTPVDELSNQLQQQLIEKCIEDIQIYLKQD